ncbi:MAG TPA: hypothetical protein ENN07_07165 [candidate division Zixibacteria bacterium]|nr:hypothetical protein [candidate division Zixibacteria bacterium]
MALVLSGGGARGLSQIGVLEVLHENGYSPNLIVGVSIGAIVGGLYSAGYSPAELGEFADQISWNELIYDTPQRTRLFQTQRMATEQFLLHLRFSNFKPRIPEGISAAQMISSLLVLRSAAANYSADGDFDRLKIPFRAVTTDLRTGEPLIFRGGDLALAMRASSAIPLFLAPIEAEGALLADGGLIYPIPVEVAIAEGASKIIAVDATADIKYPRNLDNALFILDQTTNIMAEDKKKYERKLADLLIVPELEHHGSYDFSDIASLIEAGRKAAEEKLPEIERLFRGEDKGESPRYTVSSVRSDVPLGISAGDRVSLDFLEERLGSLYREGIYRELSLEYRIDGDSIEIAVVPEFNPPMRGVKIAGVRFMELEELLSAFDIDPDKPTNLVEIDSILASIEDLYKRAGFSLAHISFAALDAETLGVIFEEGIVELVDVSGNERTRDWVVQSYSNVRAGRKFEDRQLERTMDNLHATNLFESVIPRLERGDSSAVVQLEVVEKPYFGVRLGARYDIVNSIEGAFEVGDDNLFGIAWRLNAGAFGGSRRWHAYSKLEADRIGKTLVASNFKAFATGEKYDIWDSDTIAEKLTINTYGLRISLGQQIRRFGTVFAEVGSEYVVYGPDSRNMKEYPMNRLTFRSIVDTFDKRQFPRYGKYHESYFTMSQDILGGEFSFTKAYASLQSYWTWTEPLTFHPYIMGGYMSGGPPHFERFELGHEIPFWGLRGDERRGHSFFKFGFNLRANPMDPVYIYTGIVTGRTWDKDAKLGLEDLIWGWGAGWGIATPLGPIELYWGTNTERLQQINFSFGYNFK